MPATYEIMIGRRLPAVSLAELAGGAVRPVAPYEAMGRGRALVIGVPGAFTPVCSGEHVPGLIANADRLRASGIDTLACIAANDPFVVDAWRRDIDPAGKVRFLSDGNLDFARSLGLLARDRDLFLGDRSERYLLIVQHGVIAALRVEHDLIDLHCTRVDDPEVIRI